MPHPERITFYTHVYSPYAHRAHIALEEAGADYTSYTLDAYNKPPWFVSDVNPVGKIPAIAYGGPAVPPDEPSPLSVKLAESLVLLEFLADLYPAAALLPTDPVLRARARFFINTFEARVYPDAFLDFFFRAAPRATLLDALAALQALLPPLPDGPEGDKGGEREGEGEGPFAVGWWSIADMATAPFLARIFMFLAHDMGKNSLEDGRAALAELREGSRFARLRRYMEDVHARPSFRATWDEGTQLEIWAQVALMDRNCPEHI
ncbi:hypothetical protein V8D89_004557 [Ganoderma adspersum]